MDYWLVKSEPGAWSWNDHVKAVVAEWDGVRNHQAANNLKAMKNGDKAFFYHSVNEKRVVGVLEVVREYYPDPSDEKGRFVMVDFKAIEPLASPVSLEDIKNDGRLDHIALIRQSRLSVMPLDAAAWGVICDMGGIAP
jgi:predicted RNA-binding protein with PUA-like domain